MYFNVNLQLLTKLINSTVVGVCVCELRSMLKVLPNLHLKLRFCFTDFSPKFGYCPQVLIVFRPLDYINC